MKRYLMVFLLVGITLTGAWAQESGKVILVVDESAWLDINGESKQEVLARRPHSITLPAGDHYFHLLSQADTIREIGQIVTVIAGSQEILKLSFSSEQEEAHVPPQEEGTPLQTLLDKKFIIPSLTGEVAVATGFMVATPEHEKSNVVYLAFEAGDEIHLDFSLHSKKGTNGISISTYPDNVERYANKDFRDLHDLIIRVPRRSIYRFEFFTNHLFPRDAHIAIRRRAASEATLNFNTTVSYQTRYEAVPVHRAQKLFVNSRTNFTGTTRVTLPLHFPPNTVKWYYEFSAHRNEAEINRVVGRMDLLGDLTRLIDQSGVLDFTINMLTAPPGADYCDVFLLDPSNRQLFVSKGDFRHYPVGTRTNLKSGLVEIPGVSEGFHLGIRNNDFNQGVHVAVEVVAITAVDEWVMAAD